MNMDFALDKPALSALEQLLQGGDARAQSPYGLSLPASDELIHFGSCTANPITSHTLQRYESLLHRQAWPDPKLHLRILFDAVQCQLAASGTDAEYTCALAMGDQPYCSILMDPAEIGRGCANAATGLSHVKGCPVDKPLPIHATLETTRMRHPDGGAMTQWEVDEQVFDIADRYPHTPLLLHHVPCSKTGLSAPSEAACLSIQQGHAAGAKVVVDASQGRFAIEDVRRWLGHGWAVIITGSKFFGAPPFCGATLFPMGWPKAQGFASSPGLLARWRLALDAMSASPQPTQDWERALREGFLPNLGGAVIDGDCELGRQGILSFDLGLDGAQTLRMHRALIQRGVFIGQPVSAGSRHLLRVAMGVRTRLSSAAQDLERLACAIHHEMAHG